MIGLRVVLTEKLKTIFRFAAYGVVYLLQIGKFTDYCELWKLHPSYVYLLKTFEGFFLNKKPYNGY